MTEVFASSAAPYFLGAAAEVDVIQRRSGELVRVVEHSLKEFVRQFNWALSSRLMLIWRQDTLAEMLTDVQRAARFYYLQHQRFGGKRESQIGARSPLRRQ